MKAQSTRKSSIRRVVAIVATLALFIGLAPTALASNANGVNAVTDSMVEGRNNAGDNNGRDSSRDNSGGEQNRRRDSQKYTIKTSAGDGGKIIGGGEVNAGDSVTLQIVPNPGYEIRGVTVDGKKQGAISSHTFKNVSSDHTLNATFKQTAAPKPQETSYTIKTNAGDGGSIIGGGSVKAGDSITLRIVPDPGYAIRGVSVDGHNEGALSSYTFKNVRENHTLAATFRYTGSGDPHGSYTIRTSAGEGGSINPSGDARVDRGDNITFRITPKPGYEIRSVTVDGQGVGAVSSYTFKNVRDNHTLKATFQLDHDHRDTRSYTITARAGDGGRISPSGSMNVRRNDSQSFTITPDRNYRIKDVIVDGRSIGAVSSYTFSRVNDSHEIRATFERQTRTYSIISSAGEGGSISPAGGVSVERGRNQTYKITAYRGYVIKDVIVDGRSIGATSSYTFRDVDQDHSIKVTFEREKKFELKITEAYVTNITKKSAKLVVSVRGTYEDFKYQWQVKSGSSFKNISGGRYANFTYNGLESGKSYTVRCVVTDARGNSVTSSAMTFKTEKGSWGSSTGGAKHTKYPATGYITGGSVNVRRTASTSLSPLATAHKGDKFQVVDWVSSSSFPYGFYKIRWGKTYAYVAANYMELR